MSETTIEQNGTQEGAAEEIAGAGSAEANRKAATRYIECTVELEGISPLLMHSDAGLDPLNPLVREMKEIQKKRNRTATDEQRLLELDWTLGMYFDKEDGPFLPTRNVKASFREAAGIVRKGAAVARGFLPQPMHARLEYDGPRDLNSLWEGGYRDVRSIRNAGQNAGRTLRCRPCFETWGMTFKAHIVPEDLDLDVLQIVAKRAGLLVGVGDYRPKPGGTGLGGEFGRYNARIELV